MKNPSWLGRTTRRVGLVVGGVLAVLAYPLGSTALDLIWDQLPRGFHRRLAILYLDGLLIGYALSLAGSIAMIGLVILLRLGSPSGPSRRRWRARLLAMGGSVLLSLMLLDVGAAAWNAWRHRTPRLPAFGGAGAAGAEPIPGAHARAASSPIPALPGRSSSEAHPHAPGPLRILVVGESSARGEPYHPWISVGQIVGWKLESVFPGWPVRVEIWAEGGATLAKMHHRLASLTYRPDALILYVGHNEFQARYPWMREVDWHYHDELPALTSPQSLTALLRYSPLCRLVLETWEHHRVGLRPPRYVTRELVDRPVCTADEAGRLLADFRRRLEAIAVYCEAIQTLPIFIIPAANDGGFDPSRSVLAPETPAAERRAWARDVARARALEDRDPAAATRIERELLQRHPEFAEVHYRLARLREQAGDWDEARRHYLAARECDAMPLRCPEDFRRAFREVAASHPAVLLVDGPVVLESVSPHRILDDRCFHDAQHPNLRGYAALAQDLLDQLGRRRAFGWPEGVEVPRVDADACARHFQLDAARWAEVCRREFAFYHITAYVRYDPKFRNERAAAYQRAAEAIEAGMHPD
jgi:hypothetical protein